MSKRHKMTVRIPVRLHMEIKDEADRQGLSQNDYVKSILSGEIDSEEEVREITMRWNKMFIRSRNTMIYWRAVAIAFIVGVVVQFMLLNKLNKDYIKLFNEGVPVSEDISMVEYYKAVLSNKCKIVER